MADAQHSRLLLAVARIVCANVGPGEQEYILDAVKDWPHAQQVLDDPGVPRNGRKKANPPQEHDGAGDGD